MVSPSSKVIPGRHQPHRTIVDVKFGSDGDDDSSIDELIENNPGPSTATSMSDLVAARRSSEADKIRLTNGLHLGVNNMGIPKRVSAASLPRFLPPISVYKFDSVSLKKNPKQFYTQSFFFPIPGGGGGQNYRNLHIPKKV